MTVYWLLPLALLPWTHGASGPATPAQGETAHRYLSRTFGLSSADLRSLDERRAFSSTLSVTDPREVGTLGIIRMAVTAEFYATQLADIATFKRSEAVVQIGTFSKPPHLDDVRDLTLDDGDIRNLRRCRVDDCDVQLPADLIERFRTTIDWNAPDATARANSMMRAALVDLVTRYRKAGGDALVLYADEKERVAVAAEFRDLVESERRVLPQFPKLRQYLLTPTAPLAGAGSDVIYWSKEKAGSRRVLTVTHLTILRTTSATPTAYVAASKQLYANHYFDASLGLTVLVAADAASPSTYVVYMNRSRVDTFGGLFGGVARRIVRLRARSTVSELLPRLRTRLEREFTTGRAESAR